MEFCPACHNKTRDVFFTVGSSELITLNNYIKDDKYLTINTSWKDVTEVICKINLTDNSYNLNFLNKKVVSTTKKKYMDYFFFFLESECSCNSCSYATSKDIDFPTSGKILSNFGLEREGCFVLHDSEGYHVNYAYDVNKMYLNDVNYKNTIFDKYDYIFASKKFILPIINLDFTDPQATIKKIKSLMLFS